MLTVIAALFGLSLAWYALTAILVSYGSVHFYSLLEHAVLLGYCVICYAACVVCDRWLGARRPYLAAAASFVIAGIASTAAFVAIRFALGDVEPRGVAINLVLVLLMFHGVIAATVLGVRAARRRFAVEARAELRELRQHVDPHFLFNNLHILAALIRQDPNRAEAFTKHLAALYRQVARHNRVDWALLDDELELARSYLHLISARFGTAYRVSIAVPEHSPYFVLPGVVQELLGNVVKHAHASEADPVDVELRIADDVLIADSALRPKQHAEPGAGQGLTLLAERYRRELGQPIDWSVRDGRFVVRVPLVSRP